MSRPHAEPPDGLEVTVGSVPSARLSGPSARRALLGEAARELRDAGVDAPWVEAQLLLAHALDVDWSQLLLDDDVDPAGERRFRSIVQRRRDREPLQHITGRAAFRWIELAVGPGVFVPRPETELIVDLAATDLATAERVVDLCAGSGAIALAVAHEFPRTEVVAVERAPEALNWLRRNVDDRAEHGDRRVEILAADIAGFRPHDLRGHVDVVLANPPYVPLVTTVSAEAALDPPEALFAGPDGLDLMPALAGTADWLLRPGGRLVVEHDESHAAGVRDHLTDAGFTDVRTERDLAGRERFATARKPEASSRQDGEPWA